MRLVPTAVNGLDLAERTNLGEKVMGIPLIEKDYHSRAS